MRSQVLLAHPFDELVLGGTCAERFARQLDRLVEDGALLRRQLRTRRGPALFVVVEVAALASAALHGREQGADRLVAGALDPRRLVLAPRHGHHRLRRPHRDLAGANGGTQEWPLPESPCESHHLLRRARRDAEPLASVVADAGMPEDGDAGAGPEEVERFAHRDVECTAAAGDADEERIDEPRDLVAGGFVPLAR